ncbi:MAG: hypothetical protein HWD90_00315 [Campylobacteraceae bacterium]|nr:hypothetical protein [Campylobacteraceae bacterium]
MKVKRTRPNDSIIINNLFTFATIVMVSITIVLYSNFIVKPKKEESSLSKIEKLPCQKETLTKVIVKNHELVKKSFNAIEKGYYKIEGSFLKLEKNSQIEKVLTIEEINNYIKNLLKIKPKEDLQKYLKIKYEIIESSKDKLNAGTVITSFRINSTEIFFMQSDFKFMYKNAIKQRVDCSIKVYKNYVQN